MGPRLGALAVWAVVVLGFVLVGCGQSGTTPTGDALHAATCPVTRVSSKLSVGKCRSPDGDWRLTFRQGTATGRLFLARGRRKAVEMYHSRNSCCTFMAWTGPHLLLFLDYPLVESLDPVTRRVTLLGALNGFIVSRDGRWLAGDGAAGPRDPVSTSVYVLAVGSPKCLVVPGSSVDAAGFTRDGQAVIVDRDFKDGELERRQFTLSSLHSDCPQEVETKRVTSIGS